MEKSAYGSIYARSIHEITKCNSQDLEEIEEIMRVDVVHSTLDWLTEEHFEIAALAAFEILEFNRKDEPSLQEIAV